MKRYALRSGEPLAISPDAIKRDAGGFFFMFGPDTPENEAIGSCVVVHVRGALAHFKSGDGDSYEAIVGRVADAMKRKPSHVVLRIESPGGVVAGLNEAVMKLRKMSEDAAIPLVAYVDEMAASAAYALCCACDERLAPAAAVVGSVGVISTMASQARADKENGIDFVLITSGKRKADGHPHVPISDDAVAAERARNTQLAAQFFKLASQATGLSPKKLSGLEAGIFLGDEAKRVGLIDEVIAFDAAMALLDDGTTPTDGSEDAAATAPNEGNQTDRSESLDKYREAVSTLGGESSLSDEAGDPMSVKMQALIAKMAKETDPAKVSALLVEYGMAKAESSDDDDDEPKKKGDDDDDDGGDESKSAKHAARAEKLKAKAKATDLRSKASQKKSEAAELEEEAKKCEEEAEGGDSEEKGEDKESKAALALLQEATGLTGRAALGAAAALFGDVKRQGEVLKTIQKETAGAKRAGLLESVAKCTSSAEKAMLAGFGLVELQAFVDVRLKSGLVHTDDSTLVRPKAATPGTEDSLPEGVVAMIDAATANYNGDKVSFRASQVAAHLAAHKKQLEGANGAPGRI